MIKVEIDEESGFCFGVVTAIKKAEEELTSGETLYCLGDIVHNSKEVERLKEMGLIMKNFAVYAMPKSYSVHTANHLKLIRLPKKTILKLSTLPARWCSDSKNV